MSALTVNNHMERRNWVCHVWPGRSCLLYSCTPQLLVWAKVTLGQAMLVVEYRQMLFKEMILSQKEISLFSGFFVSVAECLLCWKVLWLSRIHFSWHLGSEFYNLMPVVRSRKYHASKELNHRHSKNAVYKSVPTLCYLQYKNCHKKTAADVLC